MGAHVKKTVINRKNLRPQTSDNAPTSGALRNDNMPLIPITSPFMRNVWLGNVWLRTYIHIIKKENEKQNLNINDEKCTIITRAKKNFVHAILTFIMGIVNRPHAKNSKNITTNAWYTLGSPIPELCNYKKKKQRIRRMFIWLLPDKNNTSICRKWKSASE